MKGIPMSTTEALQREVERCDVRLTFLQRHDGLSDELRREVEQQRADAVEHLAQMASGRLTD
jgi:hypothetical protein